MISFEGKKGLVLGIANQMSIATAIAQTLSDAGAQLGFNHLPDSDERARNSKRLDKVTEGMNTVFKLPCDVSDDESLDAFFAKAKEKMGTIDFVVHSIAFAPTADIKCPTYDVSRDGFKLAMEISVHSLLAVSKRIRELMPDGGSLVSLTYFGGEKVVSGYNLMGICKAALESATRYLAHDLGSDGIRVNTISAGPIKTLSSSAISDFKTMLSHNASINPLGKNCTTADVANSAAFLLSDLASSITGETMHVDCGYNIMATP